jgi:hypothetical protein
MKAFGGNSGYVGYSISVRAVQAKNDGKYPKTEFKKVYSVSAKQFDALLYDGIICGSEWHHTSKYGNRTTFYEIVDPILFYARIGQMERAFELYKRTRRYSVPIFRNKYNRNKERFLAAAADYAFDNGLNVGSIFEFKGQKVEMYGWTNHRKHPVCCFARK